MSKNTLKIEANRLPDGKKLANLRVLINQAGAATASENHEEILQVHARFLDATSQLVRKGRQLREFCSGAMYEMADYFYVVVQGLLRERFC